MKNRCEYCDGLLEDTQERCPNCGAPNSRYQRSSVDVPRTIEELQQWYREHNLPPEEVTRFFIGRDYRGAKAFGIYRDGGRVIVYKNKADGSRAVRYDGSDEAYAVNELYLKLKERIAEQKAANGSRRSSAQHRKQSWQRAAVALGIVLILGTAAWTYGNKYNRGYYSYQGTQYYCLEDNWYFYDIINDSWYETTIDEDFAGHASDYYESDDYMPSYGTSDFSRTEYYTQWEESRNSGSGWDSDSNWDSGDSWDSGGGDWDGDW